MKKAFLLLSILFSLAIHSQETTIENIPFTIIEEAPVFPGCESYTGNAERKNCMNIKLRKHVQKNFNNDLINCLEKDYIFNRKIGKSEAHCLQKLSSGRKIITVHFIINKKGNVEKINVVAEHPKLKREGLRIAALIPQMKPGKHKGKSVRVGYTLPITFTVE